MSLGAEIWVVGRWSLVMNLGRFESLVVGKKILKIFEIENEKPLKKTLKRLLKIAQDWGGNTVPPPYDFLKYFRN